MTGFEQLSFVAAGASGESDFAVHLVEVLTQLLLV